MESQPTGATFGRDADATRTSLGTPGSFRAGDVLCDRFRVVRFIARGGMGELYEAEDVALGERVALKTIRSEIAADERVHQRFRREVQLARKVTHSNICRIFDLFQHRPTPSSSADLPSSVFVTMELLHGETLAQRLRREGKFNSEQALPIVKQLAAALTAAHAVGVIHRDFKSNNVMLLAPEHPGDPHRVVVTDFGLAHSLSDAQVARGDSITALGEVLGTPDYMAPEQIVGTAVSPATDIYALGIVLYEMVTGQRPFAADTPFQSAMRRVSGPPPRPPREVVPDLPVAWERAIMRCLSRHPEQRFADAGAVADALDPAAPSGSRWTPRRIVAAVSAAAFALAVAGTVSWRSWNATRPATSNPAAGSEAATATMRPSVAVLGFRNLAGRADAQWLSTALAEMLTTELGASETLRTIPGETVNRMKVELALADADSYSPDTLARIRQNLGSDLVVFGSYVTVGEGDQAALRVDIRLQDSREGQTVSLVSETGTSAELLELVSRAGGRLRDRLGVAAAPAMMASVRASQPATSEAARLYSEGLMRLRNFDANGARELLEKATQVEPKFALAHAAMASAWAALGYDDRARLVAKDAFELSASLPRAERLQVEGTYREMASAWKDAIGIWQTLSTFFPDDVEYVLRLANAQTDSGAAKEGLATIESFKKRFPSMKDPRLELEEASALETLSDFKRQQAAAAAAGAMGAARGARLIVASARLLEGGAALRQGQRDTSVRMFEEARRIYGDAGDRGGVARATNNLAAALSDGPDTKRTIALYEEGLAIARAIGDQRQVARFLNNLAIQQRREGNFQASLRMNQESLALRREMGDRTNAAISLNNIGNVLLDLGDFEGASDHYQQSADMSREIGDRRALARTLHNAAEALKLQGEIARSRATVEEALKIRRTIDDPASVATSLFGLGQIAAQQGDLSTARRSLTEALAMDRRLDRRRPIAYSLSHLAEVSFLEGDVSKALTLHQEALDIRTELGEKVTAAESRASLAEIALEDGRARDAEILAREAVVVFEGQAARDNEAMARATLARALLAQNRREAAQREIERARALVPNQQHVLTRLSVAIAAAQIESLSNPSVAVRALEQARDEARRRSLPRFEFDARRALAEIEGLRSRESGAKLLEALRKDAKARGFGLYAR